MHTMTHPKVRYVRRVIPRKMEDIPHPTNVITVKTRLLYSLIGSLDTLCNTKRNILLDNDGSLKVTFAPPRGYIEKSDSRIR